MRSKSHFSIETNASAACANVLAVRNEQYQTNKKKYEYVHAELFVNILEIWIQLTVLISAASVH